MKKFFILLLAGFIFVFQGCVMPSGIVDDVKQVRQSNKNADINVSDIVKKYISVGADRKVVEGYLKTQKFTLYNLPIKPDGSQALMAIYSDKNLIKFLFYDEIRVIVVFEGDTVKSVRGMLIFRSL